MKYIPDLLSTFGLGLALRGILYGKIPFVCPPQSNGIYPNCENTYRTCQIGFTGKYPNCKKEGRYQQSTTLSSTSISPLPTTLEITTPTSKLPSTYSLPTSTSSLPTSTDSVPTLSGSCETGYTGIFPDCIKLKRCRRPNVGFMPNCFLPPCPPTYTGTYPDCVRPAGPHCPFGTTGVFPNCEVQLPIKVCQDGLECSHATLPSTQPTIQPTTTTEPTLTQSISDEIVPTTLEITTQPSEIPTAAPVPTLSGSCETGYTGIFPDCIKLKRCRRPNVGFMPNCFLPPCPPTYTGTYPDCIRPAGPHCPFGTTGVFPNCEVQLLIQGCQDGLECSHAALPSTKPTIQPLTTEATLTQTISDEVVPTTLEITTLISELPLTSTLPTLSGSCETGYAGIFPDCIKLKRCRRPNVGFMPNCFLPPCPPTYTGTYPDCVRPAGPHCPFGTIGVFPKCEVQLCQEGFECSHAALPSTQPSTTTQTQPPSDQSTITLSPSNEIEWNKFKLAFNKTYIDQIEEKKRQQIFLKNREIIAAHNKLYDQGDSSYSLGINKFTDRTHEEFLRGDDGSTQAVSKEKYKDGVDSAHGREAKDV